MPAGLSGNRGVLIIAARIAFDLNKTSNSGQHSIS